MLFSDVRRAAEWPHHASSADLPGLEVASGMRSGREGHFVGSARTGASGALRWVGKRKALPHFPRCGTLSSSLAMSVGDGRLPLEPSLGAGRSLLSGHACQQAGSFLAWHAAYGQGHCLTRSLRIGGVGEAGL